MGAIRGLLARRDAARCRAGQLHGAEHAHRRAQRAFTRPATVFSQTVETGVEYNPSRNFGVRFSVDASHMGDQPSARDPDAAELGFDSATTRRIAGRSRWRSRPRITSADLRTSLRTSREIRGAL